MRIRTMGLLVLCLSAALPGEGRDLYVNRRTGSDEFSGSKALVADGDGPQRTITAAIRHAQPGDTIHLAPSGEPYPEMVAFHGKSGTADKPITLDGHGATLIGSDPLDPARWEQVAPGLYRNATLFDEIKCDDAVLARYFFVIDGEMVRMNRTSKGPKAPFKHPSELAERDWTYREEERAFYIRIHAAKCLTDYSILVPRRRNGVGVYGDSSHLVVRNVTSTYFINDGFSVSSGPGLKIRDLRFHNIRAIRCGDDGVSAHADCDFTVDGFESRENSTGICDTGNSKTSYNNVLIEGCHGYDVFFVVERAMDGGAWHAMCNSVVICNAANALVFVGESAPANRCRVQLENVLLIGNRDRSALVEVGRNATLTADRVTFFNLDFVNRGDAVSLRRSLFCGTTPPVMLMGSKAACRLESNHYAVSFMELDGERYSLELGGPDRYRDVPDDAHSVWSAWRGDEAIARASAATVGPGARLARGADSEGRMAAAERTAWETVRNQAPVSPIAGMGAETVLIQTFDRTDVFTPLSTGMRGGSNTPGGLWRPFAASGPVVSTNRWLSPPQ